MLTLTDDQWSEWLSLYVLPFFRILGLLAAAPLLSNRAIPTRVRLALAIAITLAIVPSLPPIVQPVAVGSWAILPAIIAELLIGVVIGFLIRLAFAAIDLAASLAGFQMGLSFAVFFSPTTGAQTPVLNEFIGLFATLLFLSLDGHLMLILAIAKSLHWLPPPASSLSWQTGWEMLLSVPLTLFVVAFMISLPVTAALFLTNIALGILTRTAPQLNLFAVGFPITISIGFLTLLITFPAIGEVIRNVFTDALETAEAFLVALGAVPR
ncbi:MAG: flagellar biosynthetic protein FliR [Hydrogenophilus sp.]|nr:flagellar biosynthetic protein FliR [Hydrogenophilus sp.]